MCVHHGGGAGAVGSTPVGELLLSGCMASRWGCGGAGVGRASSSCSGGADVGGWGVVPGDAHYGLRRVALLCYRRLYICSDPAEAMYPGPFHLEARDAIDWLAAQPDESVDLFVTDPPYESLEKHRRIGTTTRLKVSKSSSNTWFSIFPNARFEELFVQIYRVLRRNAHFYLFCDAETMFVAKPIAEAAGFRFWKPLIWDKVTLGMGYHYRARCERILFFEKGKRRLADLGVPDVLVVPRVRGGYPTEKPVDLMRILVSQSSSPGEVVADPFMGAGAVGIAAVSQGRRFLGNDIAPEALTIALERLLAAGGGHQPTRNDTCLLRADPSLDSLTPSVDLTPALKSGASEMATRARHRGRLQAQGRDLPAEPSQPWAQTTPLTKPEGLGHLHALQAGLPAEPRRLRAAAITKAIEFVKRLPADGIRGHFAKSFYVESPPSKARSARVDLEVNAGQAFVS